ncbi:hypothetical protein [Nocardia thailandica]|uniref:hypothetical protein n=1 Tax=Nocardia thailandica TaxID=257275 RepID=UPI0005B78ABE|nr:hypothetical protein [Nocardia thailandica]
MCDALTACDGRQVKLWDKDFNLVHTFADGESFVTMPVGSAPARAIIDHGRTKSDFRMYLTMDQSGTRWSAALAGFSVEMPTVVNGREKLHLTADWSADLFPQRVQDFGSPFDTAA